MAVTPGYQGLGNIVQLLQNGVSAQQLANMKAGATGADGMSIGGMHGAFGGLSPYAVHFLATSGLLQQQQAATVPTTDADGNPLTGSALLMANLTNSLNAANAGQGTYKLADGIDADKLGQLLGIGFNGHSAYAKGFDASGPISQGPAAGQTPFHFHPPVRPRNGGGPIHAGGGHPPIFHPGHGQLPFRTVGGGRHMGRPGMNNPFRGSRVGMRSGGPVRAVGH